MRPESTPSGQGGCVECRSRRAHLFGCLSRDVVVKLHRARFRHAYERGQVLFHEGNPPLAVYCINTGSVRLARRFRDGREVVVGTRAAGELVGYRDVLANSPYSFTAEVLEPSRICAIRPEVFQDMVRRNPALTLELLRRLATRSRQTEERLLDRVAEPVRMRLARFLLEEQDGDRPREPGQTQPIETRGREELALLIGTTRETLSRTLHEFARRGSLVLSHQGIRVVDAARLRSMLGSEIH